MFELLKEKIKNNLMKNKALCALLMVAMAAMTGNKVHAQNVMQIESTKLTKNAFLGIVIMSVMSLVVGSIFLYIGLFISTTVRNTIPTLNTTAVDNASAAYNASLAENASSNAALQSVSTNVNTAFVLGGIIMIVIGAAGIISVLLGMVPNASRR